MTPNQLSNHMQGWYWFSNICLDW